jgi:hypothetical protein
VHAVRTISPAELQLGLRSSDLQAKSSTTRPESPIHQPVEKICINNIIRWELLTSPGARFLLDCLVIIRADFCQTRILSLC